MCIWYNLCMYLVLCHVSGKTDLVTPIILFCSVLFCNQTLPGGRVQIFNQMLTSFIIITNRTMLPKLLVYFIGPITNQKALSLHLLNYFCPVTLFVFTKRPKRHMTCMTKVKVRSCCGVWNLNLPEKYLI